MKLFLSVFVLCAFASCSFAYTELTTQLLAQYFGENGEMHFQTLDQLFYNSISCDDKTNQIVSYHQSMVPAVLEYIRDVQHNYDPWCRDIETYHTATTNNMSTTMHDDLAHFHDKIGAEIDFTSNRIGEVMTANGCNEQQVSNFIDFTYRNELANKFEGNRMWNEELGYLQSTLSTSYFENFYMVIHNMMWDTTVESPVTKIKNYEYRFMKEIARSHKTALDNVKWYVVTINHHSLERLMHDIENLNARMIMSASAVAPEVVAKK